MSKQTVVSIPTHVNDYNQIRVVLLRLTEELDKLLGYRGNRTLTDSEDIAEITLAIDNLQDQINNLPVANWNEAYSWDDHATQGYLKDDSRTEQIVTDIVLALTAPLSGMTVPKVAARVCVGL